MYRPTVRYADEYKTYVDELFHATSLDRNQILRAALFSAAYSKEFHDIISRYKKKDVPTPSAGWSLGDSRWWRYQDVEKELEGMDVIAYDRGKRSHEKDSSVGDPGRGFNQKGNEKLQKPPVPRSAQGRIGPLASERGRDVIRGNGGGITITINSKNKSR